MTAKQQSTWARAIRLAAQIRAAEPAEAVRIVEQLLATAADAPVVQRHAGGRLMPRPSPSSSALTCVAGT